VPLSFLPLDRLPDTHVDLFLRACAFDAAGENGEQLPGRRIVAADHTVEPREGHVHVAACYPRVDEALRREVLDRP